MKIASVGSSQVFDPSVFINRLASGAGQDGKASAPTVTDMATTMAQTVLATADTDGDGYLTQDESGQTDEVFSRFDTDDDGFLSEEELILGMSDDITALQAMFESDTELDTSTLFDVSAAGVMAPPPPDGGGTTMEEELTANLVNSILDSADADGDGYLTLEESGQSEEVFNRFDTDADGLLSQEELITGLQEDMEAMRSGNTASAVFDLAAAGLQPPGSATETGEGSASATTSAGAAGGSASSGSSGAEKSTDTTVTVTDTPTETITTTTTTTTYTASDGTVTTSTSTSTSVEQKMSVMTSMLYQALENAARSLASNTMDIQA